MLRPGVPLTVKRAIFDGRPEPPPPPPPPPPPEFDEPEADEAMRVVLVRNLHDAADAPTDAETRRAWMDELIDEVWLECCLHGEVQRIVINADFAAVRFHSVIFDPNPNPNPNPNLNLNP